MTAQSRAGKPTIVPTPGTKRVRYLEENAGAAVVRLTEGDLGRLGAAAPIGATAGDRYPVCPGPPLRAPGRARKDGAVRVDVVRPGSAR